MDREYMGSETAKTVKESQGTREMEGLFKATDELSALVYQLESDLTPVLGSESNAKSAQGAGLSPEIALSPMVAQVRSNRLRVEGVTSQLRAILSRLEV